MATKSKAKSKARKATSKASSDNSRAAITSISLKAAKKCGERNWSFEKFKDAVVDRAKRMGVKIKTGELQAAYEANVTIPDAVRVTLAA